MSTPDSLRQAVVVRTALSLLSFFALLASAGCGGGGSSSSAAGNSSSSTTPTPIAQVPGAPTGLSATSGNAQVSLAFTVPASDGGAAINSYLATCSLGALSFSATSTASPAVVTGLVNGNSYNCSVAATNRIGTGAASSAVQALASAVPAVLNISMAAPANYIAPSLPLHYDADLAAQDNSPRNDPATDRIATLGRVLFYDKALSINDSVSCASCHQQAQGFSDTKRFSSGFAGGLTTAHAMRLGNLRYYRPGTMFWDKRAATVEAQAGQPVQNSVEMGFDSAHGGLVAVETKLQALPYYPELFRAAFGDVTVTEARVRRAIAQFERAMISSNSRWDTAYAAVYDAALPDKGISLPLASFTAQEERGRALFMLPPPQGGLGCAGCHQPPSFALSPGSLSNGLDAGETVIFKSPSLKSVGRSGAFMHDGRFSSLAQVVEHYNSGVQLGPALDNRLIAGNGQPRRHNLSDSDKAALVAFLLTLDDNSLATDPKFSDPFRR
ncbi:cytochrome c peroxidase [Paucibacter sp. AS339]|uniref:cytochrome c peroxidase n=1 Tax=Paucibacter hankyongi TaxID=3133434 RepID=UPI00309E5989